MVLCDNGNVEKLRNTIRYFRPDVTVWDPYGDLLSDELNDGEVKKTVRIIKELNAENGTELGAVSYLLNHSRMGKKEMASARGGDAGNFGKNSKKIYACARSVINIRPIFEADEQIGIELIHAKHNNTARLPLAAVRLSNNASWYVDMPDFDHDAWQRELEKPLGKNKNVLSKRNLDNADKPEEEYLSCLAQQLSSRSLPTPSGKVIKQIKNERHVSASCAKQILNDLVEDGRFGVDLWHCKMPNAYFVTTMLQKTNQENKNVDMRASRKNADRLGRGSRLRENAQH